MGYLNMLNFLMALRRSFFLAPLVVFSVSPNVCAQDRPNIDNAEVLGTTTATSADSTARPNAESEIIIGDNIRLREKPNTSSKVLFSLKKDSNIEIIRVRSKYLLVGKYFGRWAKIKYKNKVGFTLTSFIKSKSLQQEKFHVFFEKFYRIMYKGSRKEGAFLINRVNFPLNSKVYGYCDDGSKCLLKRGTIKKGDKLNVFMLGAGDGPQLKPEISLAKPKNIKVFIDFESESSFTWFFKLIKNKWYLYEVHFT